MKTVISFLLFLGALTAQAQVLNTDAFEQKFKQTLNGQLVDVRTPGEFGGGHLVGANNLDYRNPTFLQTLATLDKAKPVFVYCLSGGRSSEAAKIMREQGFASVYELEGGYLKWTTKLKPVEGVAADQSASSISQEQLNTILKSNDLVLIDFYAPWCGPCVKMMPTIDQLEKTYGAKLQVVKVNADANKALLQAYQVDEIPTLLLLKKSQTKQRLIGLQTAAYLTELIDQNIAK